MSTILRKVIYVIVSIARKVLPPLIGGNARLCGTQNGVNREPNFAVFFQARPEKQYVQILYFPRLPVKSGDNFVVNFVLILPHVRRTLADTQNIADLVVLRNYLKMGMVKKGKRTGGLVKMGESWEMVDDGKEGESADDMGSAG